MNKGDKYQRVIELARRRGFFWPSFEIYGGIGGFIDIGPLGSLLSYKIIDKWRDLFIRRHGIFEISTPVINPSIIFKASGHIESFKDPLTKCKKCNRGYRADQLLDEVTRKHSEGIKLKNLDNLISENNIRCPECGGELTKTEYFTTMFSTTIGPYSDSIGYARPETAQGMFIDFKRIFEVSRERLPLGIAQIGRAMRNEISPRQGPIRLREFTIMEFEFFYDPGNPQCTIFNDVEDFKIKIIPHESRVKEKEDIAILIVKEAIKKQLIKSKWMAYFMVVSSHLLQQFGVPFDKQRFHEKLPHERAHYSDQTFDLEVMLDRWGWTEVAGFASRTNYDLKKHMEFSGIDIRVFKTYDTPIEKTIKTFKPNPDAIRKEFGPHVKKIIKKLSLEDAEAIDKELKDKGYYQIGEWRLSQRHIKIETKHVKKTGSKFLPVVVEPSFGFERIFYTILEYAYSMREGRVVMKLPIDLAPYQAAVFPLVQKDGLNKVAKKIYHNLIEHKIDTFYDEKGSIGRRYARADEIGIPFTITVDYASMNDGTITVRDRDTWNQNRIDCKEILEHITEKYNANLGETSIFI